MMAPTTASTIPNVAKPMPEFLLMGPKCKLTALRGRGQPDERLAVGGRPGWTRGAPRSDRFPPPAVVVLADDLLAVAGQARRAMVSVAAELAGLVARPFVAERIARRGRGRCGRRGRQWRRSRGRRQARRVRPRRRGGRSGTGGRSGAGGRRGTQATPTWSPPAQRSASAKASRSPRSRTRRLTRLRVSAPRSSDSSRPASLASRRVVWVGAKVPRYSRQFPCPSGAPPLRYVHRLTDKPAWSSMARTATRANRPGPQGL